MPSVYVADHLAFRSHVVLGYDASFRRPVPFEIAQQRQTNGKGRTSISAGAVRMGAAVVQLNGVASDREAESEAVLADAVPALAESIEHMTEQIVVDSFPGVVERRIRRRVR